MSVLKQPNYSLYVKLEGHAESKYLHQRIIRHIKEKFWIRSFIRFTQKATEFLFGLYPNHP